ncbi:MAG: phenylalanine--tRNA ligase subunit beta [Clostridiales bacterium]|nr:phenylalanine--tRNA ligase subunit beta [Clostridiales bacterium]
MLVPIEWLKDYIDIDVDIPEYCEKMIMSGSNVEAAHCFDEEIENIVVGKIVKIEKHPDADKLLVCTVNVGDVEPVQIVTGATNVFEGAVIPVAAHGSRLPGPMHGQPKQEGGVKIKKGKLRGVESAGMLCSASELGFADKVIQAAHRDGIWILNENHTLGQDIVEALGLAHSVVDFEITPNRPDCLSILGMARETGAVFKKKFRYPETECVHEVENVDQYVSVDIKNTELCKRYVARVVKDVKVEESPWWLQKRLMKAGMRPINNIVDITNFVMLEYGQPIHAFDIRHVAGRKIVVDTASAGDLFTTLDGTERKLESDMLLIKDAEKGIALAGVMGGLNSEIAEDTTTIVIESANFDKDNIRATSKKIGLRTEASARFEKGLDSGLCLTAADRVCKLIELLGAGTVVKGAVDVYPSPTSAHTVDVRVARINSILGVDLSASEMAELFGRLEMQVSAAGDVLKVTPPTVRQDLNREIDFVEEVARLYGYDQLPVTIPKGSSRAGKTRERMLKDLAKDVMCGLGANEIQTYSFVSPKGVANIRLDGDARESRFVEIVNPLGEENSVMRTVLTPNMLDVLGRNFSRNIPKVRAFEIGNTFGRNVAEEAELPEEQDAMAIAAYGQGESFFTVKGMVVELLANLGIHEPGFVAESSYGAYHPGRCARIMLGETELGIMGEVHPDVAEQYGIGTKAYCCELTFDTVMKHANLEKAYKPLPKYPSVSRDIALLVDEDIAVEAIRTIITGEGGSILESVKLFDVYRGKQVADGKKSVAFALAYRASDRTLTDEDVAKVHDKILKALSNQLNAVLREM